MSNRKRGSPNSSYNAHTRVQQNSEDEYTVEVKVNQETGNFGEQMELRPDQYYNDEPEVQYSNRSSRKSSAQRSIQGSNSPSKKKSASHR
jgi:hypothetical protein